MLDLADDSKFVMGLNDSQKLDYLLLLLMAGLTDNAIPMDYNWFKSRFHLDKNPSEIESNFQVIKAKFRKFKVYKKTYKFGNFKELHNYIYKEKENNLNVLKEFYKNSPNKVNLFLIISNLINYFIDLKGFKQEDVGMVERNRYGARIKELLVLTKGDSNVAKDCMKWVSEKWADMWVLETCIKKFADYKASLNKKETSRYKEL